MKRIIGAILFVIYSIIAITVTVLLLSFNDYKMSEIGGYTVFIVNNDSFEDYEEGSILLIKETSDRNVKVGDEIFLYRVYNSNEFEVVTRKLESKVQQGRHMIYGVSGEGATSGESYSNEYFIGKADDVTVISSPWGTVLSILESKWGYLFCIVIVSLLLFLQEVFDLVIEIKYGGTKGTKAANVANARKAAAKKKTTTTKTATAKPTTTKVATAVKTVAKTTEVNNTQTVVKEEE